MNNNLAKTNVEELNIIYESVSLKFLPFLCELDAFAWA